MNHRQSQTSIRSSERSHKKANTMSTFPTTITMSRTVNTTTTTTSHFRDAVVGTSSYEYQSGFEPNLDQPAPNSPDCSSFLSGR